VDGYREFWNQFYYGTTNVGVGSDDVQSYWVRIALIAGVSFLIGAGAFRVLWAPWALTLLLVLLYAASVGPFMVWSARCGGCGASFSYDSARSYEAMIINQWWGGLLAMSVAAAWLGVASGQRILGRGTSS
jgi:hypothetical protein